MSEFWVGIAISGKMGSGKTTLADELIKQVHESHPDVATKVSLAAPVKEVAYKYFLMPEDVKDRQLLQKIGQNFRHIKEDVWVDLMLNNVEALTDTTSTDIVICDDMRFSNELNVLKQDGWFIIRLTVDEEEQKRRLECAYGDSWTTHWENRNEISETDLDNSEDFNMTLHNLPLEEVPFTASEILETIHDWIRRPQP